MKIKLDENLHVALVVGGGTARVTDTAGGLELTGRSATAAFPVDRARQVWLAYDR
ncbi:MAG: hypothetical protein WD232_09635 [Acidimicrobiales bacterium]